jgi:iduronate 2-sulfatase
MKLSSVLLSTALLTPSSFFCQTLKSEKQASKKNVLLIMADDMNWVLGCYGHKQIKTPNIDALAEHSIRFNKAYCQVSVSNPSRSSLLTGLRPDKTGIYGNNYSVRELHPDVVTMPQYFKENGYWTGVTGKIFHFGNDDEKSWTWIQPWNPDSLGEKSKDHRWRFSEEKTTKGEGGHVGKERWMNWRAVESGLLQDDRTANFAMEQINSLSKDQAFFFGVGFIRPHDAFYAPKRFFDLYPIESMQLPAQDETYPIPESAYGWKPWLKSFKTMNDLEKKELMRAYFAGVSYMDEQVGKVITALKQKGLYDNTIIVFMGDNGYHQWEKNWFAKCTVWELSARVPLIISTPEGREHPAVCDRVVELLDLCPTLVELAGLNPIPGRDGRSLLPLIKNPALPEKRWKGKAFTQFGETRSVRTDQFRYCEWGSVDEALFDHISDPDEKINLAKDPKYKDLIQKFRSELKQKAGFGK